MSNKICFDYNNEIRPLLLNELKRYVSMDFVKKQIKYECILMSVNIINIALVLFACMNVSCQISTTLSLLGGVGGKMQDYFQQSHHETQFLHLVCVTGRYLLLIKFRKHLYPLT